ncbi:unnamed protein product [Rotaria socialis]|nr:unnamed protein product [Rotaria socialis]
MIVVAYIDKKTTIAELLLVKQKQLPPHVLHVHTFSSQACESIFRNTRALSGIYSTIINFTVRDFLRRAQRLSLLNDITFKQLNDNPVNNFVFPVHHKHRKDRQSSFTQSQRDIDQIDIERIITDAYREAVDMLDRLEILNLLKEKRALGLNLLSEYVFKQLNSNSKMYDYSSQLSNIDDEEFEFELVDDNDDDDERADDLNMDDGNNDSTSSNDDHIDDDDEQDDTQNLINTTKDDYVGIKIFNTIQTHIEHSCFEVTINDDMKYMHKQTACWLLTGEKNNFLRLAQKLSILNQIKYDDSLVSSNQLAEIDKLDVEEIISNAYGQAMYIVKHSEILNGLKRYNIINLTDLSTFLFDSFTKSSKMFGYSSRATSDDDDYQEFELNEEENYIQDLLDDEMLFDFEDNDDDSDQEMLNSTKSAFNGIKIVNNINPILRKSYFKIRINEKNKYLHKQLAC